MSNRELSLSNESTVTKYTKNQKLIYKEHIITTSFEKSVKDIRSMHKISLSFTKIEKKSSHKCFVTYDRDLTKINF